MTSICRVPLKTFQFIFIDIPAEAKKAIVAFKPSAKIERNGPDEYTYSSTKTNGSTVTNTFKSGVEYEETLYGKSVSVDFVVFVR